MYHRSAYISHVLDIVADAVIVSRWVNKTREVAMEGLFDSVTARVVGGAVVLALSIASLYMLHAYWFFTRIDFGNISFQVVLFTRHDNWADGHKEDFVVLENVGSRTSLRELYGNRLSFWIVVLRSMKVTVAQPVLDFGKHAHGILSPVRGRLSAIWSGMIFKRAAGFSCRQVDYKLALVYDRSDDRSTYVVKGILLRNEDINNFGRYKKPRPMNSENYLFVSRIVSAFHEGKGSFIDVRVTSA